MWSCFLALHFFFTVGFKGAAVVFRIPNVICLTSHHSPKRQMRCIQCRMSMSHKYCYFLISSEVTALLQATENCFVCVPNHSYNLFMYGFFPFSPTITDTIFILDWGRMTIIQFWLWLNQYRARFRLSSAWVALGSVNSCYFSLEIASVFPF